MKRARFGSMPLLAQATSMLTLFMAWVMIEEWIIDRHGLDRYLPFYRVGNLCVYDLTVALAILVFWRTQRSADIER